jgi:uncharacterized protein (UPF0332 family)
MMQAQENLLVGARDSLSAARLLHREGHHGCAASRAYYTMFRVAEAFLLVKGLAFSKHSAIHAAFGEHFVRTGIVPAELHRASIHGMEVRQTGDYDYMKEVPRGSSGIDGERGAFPPSRHQDLGTHSGL